MEVLLIFLRSADGIRVMILKKSSYIRETNAKVLQGDVWGLRR